jgi:hypothetical protein
MEEPIQDIAHLGYIELLTPKPDESLLACPVLTNTGGAGRRLVSVYDIHIVASLPIIRC